MRKLKKTIKGSLKHILGKTTPDSLKIQIGKEKILFDTSSEIAKQWFYPRYQKGAMHEPIVSKLLMDKLRENEIFFDIGANVGYFTCLAGLYIQKGEVHSFELDPTLVNEINSNLNLNGIHNSVIFCGAIWNNNNDVLSFEPHQNENKSTNVAKVSNGRINTGSITLDTYCKKKKIHPSIIKIDVEGAEAKVLRGAQEMARFIETMFLEIHPSLLEVSEKRYIIT